MKKIINKLFLKLSLVAALGVLISCSSDDGGRDIVNQRDFSIAAYLTAGSNTQTGAYNSIYDALVKADLLATLESGEFTLLAPSDAAFAAAGVDVNDVDAADLAVILNYHLISSSVDDDALIGRIATANGATISSALVDGEIKVNGVATATKHITLTNGIVYNLDALLTPPAGNVEAVLAANSELALAASAFAKSGISLTGASLITAFVPNDDAMTAAGYDAAGIAAATAGDLATFLNYHIISGDLFTPSFTSQLYASVRGSLSEVPGLDVSAGDNLEVNGSAVVNANEIASNGVVHVIEGALTPPVTVLDALGPNADVSGGNDGVIYDGLYAGMVRVGLDATYLADLTKSYTVAGPCCGAFNEANYPADADLIAAIEAHIFEGTVNLFGGPEGSSVVESVGGDKYIINSNAFGNFIYGGSRYFSPFGAASTAGNTTVFNGLMVAARLMTGLSAETVTDDMDADASYDLFSAAIKALDATSSATGLYTLLAIDNATFSAAYTYTTVAEVEAADSEEFVDLLNHVIMGAYYNLDLFDGSFPAMTAASGNAIVLTETATSAGVLVNPANISYLPEITLTDLYYSNNGVVHEIDEVITF